MESLVQLIMIVCFIQAISPYALFFLNKKRELVPVAIQLFSHRKENNPVS